MNLDTVLDRLAKRFDLRYCPCCGRASDAPISHCSCPNCMNNPNCCMACGHAIGSKFSKDDHDVRADEGDIQCPVRWTRSLDEQEGVRYEPKATA